MAGRRVRRRACLGTRALVLAVAALASSAPARIDAPPTPPQDAGRGQQVPSFRAGVVAVPLDVRVVDKDGRPITDLKKEDFTILEDGAPQAIAHFAVQVLAGGTPRPGLRAGPAAQPFDPSPQNDRVFLIVLGSGSFGPRHPDTLAALIAFVRERLLPQDQVAVLAPPRGPNDYNRAIDFTSDHEKVVQFLEALQPKPAPAQPAGGKSSPPAGAGRSVFSPAAVLDHAPAIKTDLGFEEYLKAWGKQTLGFDADYVLYALKYLRFLSGQKHLLFVAERGFQVPVYRDGAFHLEVLWEQAKYVTSVANDARVALHTIQIGEPVVSWQVPRLAPDPIAVPQRGAGAGSQGVEGSRESGAGGMPPTGIEGGGGRTAMVAVAGGAVVSGSASSVFDNALQAAGGGLYNLGYFAAQTGGQSSILKAADVALGRIDTATRAHYLLAYYPSNDTRDARLRTIKVTVNRPGATVLFRHGYFATPEADLFDRRRVVSNARITAAGYQLDAVREIDVTLVPSFRKADTGGGGEVLVSLSIDVSRVAWTRGADGRYVARLEVAVYCADEEDRIFGQSRRLLNLALTDATYEKMMKDRFTREMRVTVTKKPRFVKAVVYDYDADRLGSVLVRLR